jgi:hypothetical protein
MIPVWPMNGFGAVKIVSTLSTACESMLDSEGIEVSRLMKTL